MVPLSILLDYEGYLLLREIYDSVQQPSTPQSYRLSTAWHPEQGRTEPSSGRWLRRPHHHIAPVIIFT